VRSLSQIFHPQSPSRPLSSILRDAREAAGLTLDQAASKAQVPVGEILAMEEGRPLGTDPSFARVRVCSYARVIGLDPASLREDLPDSPDLVPGKECYLKRGNRLAAPPFRFGPGLMSVLAPLGRACIYLLLVATLASTWGLMRQLSRVRSIPWITSTSSLSSFQVR